MKVRHGFVSNSSTSSFQCCVCHETQAGMDMCLSEAGMRECINGHTFCDEHGKVDVELNVEQKRQKLIEDGGYEAEELADLDDDDIKEKYEYEIDEYYEVPEACCPVCQMEVGIADDLLKFMLIKHQTTEGDVLAEVHGQFKSYAEFAAYLKQNK
jgi:hypothetical protein